MKKIMVLGASYLQNWIIDAVHDEGYYAIALDGNKECESICRADAFYHIDFSNKDMALELAMREKIDGVLTYASDTAALTASYIAEKMGLAGNPYNSVEILTDKSKTREYLRGNGFNVPESISVCSIEEVEYISKKLTYPAIVKPADACGSRGLSKINDIGEIKEAYYHALSFSKKKKVVIEEYIVREGYQLEAEVFVSGGKIIYFEPMFQHQDCLAPFSPIGNSMPIEMEENRKSLVRNELQLFFDGLDMKFGIFNVEFIFDHNDKLFFLEVAPRAGGNLISEMNYYSSGIMLRKNLVEATMGKAITLPTKIRKDYASCLLIHSEKAGIYKDMRIADCFPGKVIFKDMFVKKSDEIHEFTNGKYGIGLSIMLFENRESMLDVMNNSTKYFKIELEGQF